LIQEHYINFARNVNTLPPAAARFTAAVRNFV